MLSVPKVNHYEGSM